MEISVYGVPYKIRYSGVKGDFANDTTAYCDIQSKDIVISFDPERPYTAEMFKRILVHELVHAAAWETGVDFDKNETLTEWISKFALDFEKLLNQVNEMAEKVTINE